MGQKVNPHGLRVGVIKDWDSRWYAREDKVGDLVVEDFNIRKYLKNKLYVSKVWVAPGPILKRGRATARGRYSRILKRTSHITVVVAEKEA